MSSPAIPQPELDQVQHPTLGALKFPKDMPYSQRNQIIADMETQQAASRAPSVPTSFGQMLSNAATPEVRQAYNDTTNTNFQPSDAVFPASRGISALKATLGYLRNLGGQQAQNISTLGNAGVLSPGQTGALSYPGSVLESTGRIGSGMLEPKNVAMGVAASIPALRPFIGGYMALSGGRDVATGQQPNESSADALERRLLGASGVAAGLAGVRSRAAASRAGSQPESLSGSEPVKASPAAEANQSPPTSTTDLEAVRQLLKKRQGTAAGAQPAGGTPIEPTSTTLGQRSPVAGTNDSFDYPIMRGGQKIGQARIVINGNEAHVGLVAPEGYRAGDPPMKLGADAARALKNQFESDNPGIKLRYTPGTATAERVAARAQRRGDQPQPAGDMFEQLLSLAKQRFPLPEEAPVQTPSMEDLLRQSIANAQKGRIVQR